MQAHHTSGAGSDAIASAFQNRRNFLFATAGVIALLSAAANAAPAAMADDQLSPQETALMAAIAEYTRVVAERQKLTAIFREIYATRPEVGVRLAEVITEGSDYRAENHGRRFSEKIEIQRFFGRMRTRAEVTTVAFERMGADFKAAMALFKQRDRALSSWLGARPELDVEYDQLSDERDRLEKEICGIPCAGPRMAVIKARFACQHLLPDELHIDVEGIGSTYLPAMLRSIADLGTSAAIVGCGVQPALAYSTSPREEDPLIAEIAAYRAGLAQFEQIEIHGDGRDEEAWDRTFLPHETALENWEEPARSSAAAAQALSLALDQLEDHAVDGPSIAMVQAALGFLEARA